MVPGTALESLCERGLQMPIPLMFTCIPPPCIARMGVQERRLGSVDAGLPGEARRLAALENNIELPPGAADELTETP